MPRSVQFVLLFFVALMLLLAQGAAIGVDSAVAHSEQGVSCETADDVGASCAEGTGRGYTPAKTIEEPCSVALMPVGDSITRGGIGSSDQSGYRRFLWLGLNDAGYNVDFVGRWELGLSEDFDRHHEGHDGIGAEALGSIMTTVLSSNPPDIVLLHIGTNNISSNSTVDDTAQAIDGILDKIDAFEASPQFGRPIVVILAQIINRANWPEQIARTSELNMAIADLVAQRSAAGDLIQLVNMEPALAYPNDLVDHVHPNEVGYEKMAGVWLGALEEAIPQVCAARRPFALYLASVWGAGG